jgi:hypothetical protein
MQDIILRTLFIVDDELHRDARTVRPFRVGRVLAIADHVARIIFTHARLLLVIAAQR